LILKLPEKLKASCSDTETTDKLLALKKRFQEQKEQIYPWLLDSFMRVWIPAFAGMTVIKRLPLIREYYV